MLLPSSTIDLSITFNTKLVRHFTQVHRQRNTSSIPTFYLCPFVSNTTMTAITTSRLFYLYAISVVCTAYASPVVRQTTPLVFGEYSYRQHPL